MKYPLTGVILAGGLNKRFYGNNKAFIRIEDKRLLDRIYGIFEEVFEEIILVTNDPLQYLEWDFKIVTDLFPIRSSLTGIHSGLFHAAKQVAFFAACDIPFLRKEIVETVVEAFDPKYDAIIPETSAGLEPLCAVYSKNCLKPIEMSLAQQELKIQRFFKTVRIKKIPETVLREKDPDLISFFNINTPDELERANHFIQQNGWQRKSNEHIKSD